MGRGPQATAPGLPPLPPVPTVVVSAPTQAMLVRLVAAALIPPRASLAVPDRALRDFVAATPPRGRTDDNPWAAAAGPAMPVPSPRPAANAVQVVSMASGWNGNATAIGPGPQTTPEAAAPAGVSADWGVRPKPPALPVALPPSALDAAIPPYGAAATGALASLAAATRLMRQGGFGDPRNTPAATRLASAIEAFDRIIAATPPVDPEALGRFMHWAGIARQVAFVRARLGIDPADPEQHPALTAALQDRGAWLADRPFWEGRDAASANVAGWLPLVDCAEAFGLRVRGPGALHDLGAAIRQAAALELPQQRDPARMAEMLSVLDAVAAVEECFGVDLDDPAAAARLQSAARALERAPDPPQTEPGWVLDRSCLDRVRSLDRSQADDLRLDAIGRTGIPLLASGLPVLAAIDAIERRARRRAAWLARASG